MSGGSMTPELIAFIGQYGLPITMLVIVLASGARGTWRWGREVDAANLRADNAELRSDGWRDIALKAMSGGTRAVEVAAKVVANGSEK